MAFLFRTGLIWGLASCAFALWGGARDHGAMAAGDLAFTAAVLVCGYGAAGGMFGILARWLSRRMPARGSIAVAFPLFCMVAFEALWRVREYGPALPALSAPRLALAACALGVSAVLAACIAGLVRRMRPAALDPARGGAAGPALCLALLCAALGADALIGPQAYHALARPPRSQPQGQKPDIVLVTVDTLTVRAMGAYGFGEPGRTFRFAGMDPVDAPHEYWSPATPQMDALAGEGVVLDRMITPVPLTTPSHASIMTGLPPRKTKVVNNAVPLPDSLETLAERLRARGYDTGAFVNKELCSSFVNMQQGFDAMYLGGANDGPAYRALARASLPGAWMLLRDKLRQWRGRGAEGQASVDQAVRWIAARDGRPFFLWLHLYNPHAPYDPPEPFRRLMGVASAPPWTGDKSLSVYREQRKLSGEEYYEMLALYHGDVAHADELVGRVAEELFHRGLSDRTALIVTADHGELLYEHDRYIGHAARLYEPILRVPFIMRYPEKIPPGIRRNQLVSTLDITPTVLKLAGISQEPDMPGMDLMPLIAAPPLAGGGHESLVSETFYPESERDMLSITGGDLRMTVTPGTGKRVLNALSTHILYLEDPENLYGEIDTAAQTQELDMQLDAWRRNAGPRPQPPIQTKKLMKRLKSLGYVR